MEGKMKSKKILTCLLSLALICSLSFSVQAAETIKIGCIDPMSGSFAALGLEAVDNFNIAAEKFLSLPAISTKLKVKPEALSNWGSLFLIATVKESSNRIKGRTPEGLENCSHLKDSVPCEAGFSPALSQPDMGRNQSCFNW